MGFCSEIYSWAGSRKDSKKQSKNCSKAKHAELIDRSGKALFETRKKAYDWYVKECIAWGREPAPEQTWFANANAVAVRLRMEDKRSATNG